MEKNDILERELENLNSNGSLKKKIFGGIPSKQTIDKNKEEMNEFNLRMLNDNIKSLDSLAIYISEYLEKFGSISGEIRASEPNYIGSDEYSSLVEYDFLGRSVEERIKMGKEDIKEYFQEIKDSFTSYFPKHSIKFIKDGKVVLR